MKKNELKEIIKSDKRLYKDKSLKKNFYYILSNNPRRKILKYIIYHRKCVFYKNKNNRLYYKLLFLIYSNRKNRLGIKLNLDIGNCELGKNVMIYHRNIVINPYSNIGNNCKFHGNNCIGNKNDELKAPTLENNIDIGFGASIIGDVYIAEGIKIGANSIVTKSFYEKNITIAGNPAKKIK